MFKIKFPIIHFIFSFGLLMISPAEAATHVAINDYIKQTWGALQRVSTSCEAIQDPKIKTNHTLYLPHGFTVPETVKILHKNCPGINIQFLPRHIKRIGDIKTTELKIHGLLYLPHPYVVPGGRFNEMYGWDSYFIVLGLLENNEDQLAYDMLENYFFEVKYYGGILNANRTYYLSRSQPPFLSSTVLAVYDKLKIKKRLGKAWLTQAYKLTKQEYAQWVQAPFLAGDTMLSRFFDMEDTPIIEVQDSPGYHEHIATQMPSGRLPDDFYKGERSLSSSGFDITFRFGPYGSKTHHYAAVCLNSLLYKTEKDLSHIATLLGKTKEALDWDKRAALRQSLMEKYLWDKKLGIFVDYDFITKQRSAYRYATTFYPLWAGLANEKQAKAIVKNIPVFKFSGGLVASDQDTGVQWDKPYGWAPMHLLAVQGLLKYGFHKEAEDIATRFNLTVFCSFQKTQSIFEKYDVVNSSSTISVDAGYQVNVVGFGWTNATYLLFQELFQIQDKGYPCNGQVLVADNVVNG